MKSRALVVMNPIAGGGRSLTIAAGLRSNPVAARALAIEARVSDCAQWDWLETTADGRWKEKLKSELETGVIGLVVVIGGDGTLMEAATTVFGEKKRNSSLVTKLAFLPGGRGNDFIRGLFGFTHKDGDFWAWAEKQKRWVSEKLDLGSCNGKLFLNMLSIGYGGRVVEKVHTRRAPWSKSQFVYQIEGALALAETPVVQCEIKVAGQTQYQGPFWASFVGNGPVNGAGLYWVPQARSNDGKLDTLSFARPGFFPMLASLDRIKKQKPVSFPHQLFTGSEISFHFDQPVPIDFDGDFGGRALHYGITCLAHVLDTWVLKL